MHALSHPMHTHTYTQMYKEDGLSRKQIETLVAAFGNQALDFFGALRSATYDGQIRDWMEDVAGEEVKGRREGGSVFFAQREARQRGQAIEIGMLGMTDE